RRREPALRLAQAFQGLLQDRIVAPALTGRPFRPPLPLRVMGRLPLLRNLPGRMIGFGLERGRIEDPLAPSLASAPPAPAAGTRSRAPSSVSGWRPSASGSKGRSPTFPAA